MESVAYLRVMETDTCLREILRLLRKTWRGVVRSERKMKFRQRGAGLIIWCHNGLQRLLPAQARYLVGEEGFILYTWKCPNCGKIVRAYEYPKEESRNAYFGCMCPETYIKYSLK